MSDNTTQSEATRTGGDTAPTAPPRQRRTRRLRASVVTAVTALALTAAAAGMTMTTPEAAGASAVSADESSLSSSELLSDLDLYLDAWGSGGTSANRPGGQTDPSAGSDSGTWSGGGSMQSGEESWRGTMTAQEGATTASDSESTGVVLISTVLAYEDAEAAGSGMALTSDGLILTNNHVVEGATEITVTLGTTGATYTATLVGTDATNDVALLQLEGASNLATVTIDDDALAVGDTVTAVGNADGGGILMAADGTVTELESSVTTSSYSTTRSETLDGMIEFTADVVSGDSGGALIDDEGEVIGMTTAASSGLATTIAYAVPIDDALGIVEQILAGDESGTVTIGYPAMLGVGIASDTTMTIGGAGASAGVGTMPGRQSQQTTETGGANVQYVYADTPAEQAGLTAGDTITAVDSTEVTSGSDLSSLLATYEPGDAVTLTWTTASGTTETATVTLIEGPVG